MLPATGHMDLTSAAGTAFTFIAPRGFAHLAHLRVSFHKKNGWMDEPGVQHSPVFAEEPSQRTVAASTGFVQSSPKRCHQKRSPMAQHQRSSHQRIHKNSMMMKKWRMSSRQRRRVNLYLKANNYPTQKVPLGANNYIKVQ